MRKLVIDVQVGSRINISIRIIAPFISLALFITVDSIKPEFRRDHTSAQIRGLKWPWKWITLIIARNRCTHRYTRVTWGRAGGWRNGGREAYDKRQEGEIARIIDYHFFFIAFVIAYTSVCPVCVIRRRRFGIHDRLCMQQFLHPTLLDSQTRMSALRYTQRAREIEREKENLSTVIDPRLDPRDHDRVCSWNK